jgi:hypothetical protein
MMQIGQVMNKESPKVKIPRRTEMISMITAPPTVLYSIPSGPSRTVRRIAIPTLFGEIARTWVTT